MRKCCFVIPYFGRFNNYFPLFLKSCGYNKDFNWLIITDDRTEYSYPENVRVVYTTFSRLRELVDEKFGFHTALERPYKLCDLKPMYGFIFEEELRGYVAWGHCDLDTIMGDLGSFITDEMLSGYDKLFCLGHMTIYRNTEENNRVFMSDYKGVPLFKTVLQNPKNSWFDEEYLDDNNINRIFHAQGKRVYEKDLSLNFNIKYSRFIRTVFVGRQAENDGHGYRDEKFRPALYLWEHGQVCRFYMKHHKLVGEDFMYLHLQKRSMRVDRSVCGREVFKIVPNRFLPLEVDDVTAENFSKIRKTYFCSQYYKICIAPKIKSLFKFHR